MVKYTLWGNEVDLDLREETFPTEKELKEMDDILPGSEHGWFPSTTGKKLHYRKYLPAGTPKAVCVWQHGMQGHSGIAFKLNDGRITNFALLSRELLKAGYALYTADMLGHGFSEGTRFYIPDWKVNRDDLDAFARFAASQHSEGMPIFLGGDSIGACFAIHVARKWQNAAVDSSAEPPPKGFRGITVNAPAIIGDLPPYPVVFVLRYILKPMCPKWSPFFMPNPVSAERIWKDPEVRALQTSARRKEMELQGSGRPYTLGSADGLLCATEHVREAAIPGLTVPFCVAHGTDDMAVPIAGTDFLLEHATTGSEDRAVFRVEGAYHDLMGDPTAEKTMEFILDWIGKRITMQSAL